MTPKVFCSHRSVDKREVEDFVRRLRHRGIDAWFDTWEIQPGDDIVVRINQGPRSVNCSRLRAQFRVAGYELETETTGGLADARRG
jgi:hypothetical protein